MQVWTQPNAENKKSSETRCHKALGHPIVIVVFKLTEDSSCRLDAKPRRKLWSRENCGEQQLLREGTVCDMGKCRFYPEPPASTAFVNGTWVGVRKTTSRVPLPPLPLKSALAVGFTTVAVYSMVGGGTRTFHWNIVR